MANALTRDQYNAWFPSHAPQYTYDSLLAAAASRTEFAHFGNNGDATIDKQEVAAFMANVYGRLSTYPGVCLATLGPGATNLLTGVADATLDGAPLVALTGQAGLERIHKRSHQYVDVLGMFAPVVKWAARIELPDGAPPGTGKDSRARIVIGLII